MSEIRVDLEALEHDPGKRIPISRYDVNVRDSVRRRYIELGPCQPKNHDFKYRDIDISGHPRHFCPVWFKENKWLEYSVEKDAAFCFVCYDRYNLTSILLRISYDFIYIYIYIYIWHIHSQIPGSATVAR